MQSLAVAIVLLPLLAAILGPLGYKLGDKFTQLTTTGLVSLAALFSVVVYFSLAMGGVEAFEVTLYHWLTVGNLDVTFGVMADKLSATMFMVVTIVSACVHIYSWGYMADDAGKIRFFSYLSLFTFAMLALVSAPNLVQLFLGWEGVGVASYLLIGYYFHKESANAAAMKAFIVNRVADAALILGLCTAFVLFGTFGFNEMFSMIHTVPGLLEQTYRFLGHNWNVAELLALLLFIGAMGKSAQLGLHTWLPDAMEGPTPVSALIHAATMVTAGVFLLARMSPLFNEAPAVLAFVAVVGGLTAIFAATIGLAQRDIKRVIAYSTMSQLGYMFFACGVAAYGAAMFHLTTHAFFKALLFLGAGAVIHAMHHEQDMFKMGGLKKVMILTYALMWIGSLALAGIPPFAGFWSKEYILEFAFLNGTELGYFLYAIGTAAALLTAVYSFRLLFMVFHGEPRDKKAFKHAHEVGPVMWAPMALLAVGAVLGGFIFYDMHKVSWWAGAIADIHHGHHGEHHISLIAKYAPLLVVLSGIATAVWLWLKRPHLPAKLAEGMQPLPTFLERKWMVDELYQTIIVNPLAKLSHLLWQRGDVQGIDRFGPNGAAALMRWSARRLAVLQSGYIHHYAFAFVLLLVGLFTYLLLKEVL